MKKKIVIVNDQKDFTLAFKSMLDAIDNVELIADVTDEQELFQILEYHIPDIVFIDIDINQLDYLEVIKKTSNRYRFTKVIALSFHKDIHTLHEIFKAGARNYLIKDDITKDRLENIFFN